MRKKILVTGGLGYIGSHTCIALINQGYQPIIIDNLSNTHRSVLYRLESLVNEDIPYYQVDILDQEKLYHILEEHKIDAVIHFAAFKAVGESVQHPLKYYENNIGGLISLLKVLHSQKVSKIVFSSSCTVYGEPEKLPVEESEPFKDATSPYGSTKQMSEEILRDTDLNCVALRYFNPIGAHPSGKIGEMPIGVPGNLIPYITQTAIGKRKQLKVNGNDYPTPDGTNIRDYIDVMDLADAHVAALELLFQKDIKFEAINIGTGVGVSVLEVIQTFEKVNNLQLNYTIGPRRAGDIIQVYANANKAKELLNWTAKRTLSESLSTAWKWEQYAASLDD